MVPPHAERHKIQPELSGRCGMRTGLDTSYRIGCGSQQMSIYWMSICASQKSQADGPLRNFQSVDFYATHKNPVVIGWYWQDELVGDGACHQT